MRQGGGGGTAFLGGSPMMDVLNQAPRTNRDMAELIPALYAIASPVLSFIVLAVATPVASLTSRGAPSRNLS